MIIASRLNKVFFWGGGGGGSGKRIELYFILQFFLGLGLFVIDHALQNGAG